MENTTQVNKIDMQNQTKQNNALEKYTPTKNTLYNRQRYPTPITGESLTQQHELEASDINNIIKKYQVTGELPEPRFGSYVDISDIPDYQTSLNIVQQADEAFKRLPSKVRGRFMNDPQTLLTWLRDSNNLSEAIELGLVEKPKKDVVTTTETKPV